MGTLGFFWIVMVTILVAIQARRGEWAEAVATPPDGPGRLGKDVDEGWGPPFVILTAVVGAVAATVVLVVLIVLYRLTVGTVPPASLTVALSTLTSAGSALAVWVVLRPRRAERLFERFERECLGERARAGLLGAVSVLAVIYALVAAAFGVFILCRLAFFHEPWEPIYFLLVPGLAAAAAVLARVAPRASRDRGFLGRCGRAWSAAVAEFAAPDPDDPKPKAARADRDFD